MPLYEHIFLARQDVSGQQVETLTESFNQIIQDNGGTIGKVEYWGLRPIAFRIKKNRKAHYTLVNIDAPHDAVAEMERQMRINEDVIRFMTVRVDELDDNPSAILTRRDRDDRRGGGGRRDRDRPPRRDDDGGSRGDGDAPAEAKADRQTDSKTETDGGDE